MVVHILRGNPKGNNRLIEGISTSTVADLHILQGKKSHYLLPKIARLETKISRLAQGQLGLLWNEYMRIYPLIDPNSAPLAKYFCKNGYTSRIGTVATTMTAILIVCSGGAM